jgi:hypothetical protein
MRSLSVRQAAALARPFVNLTRAASLHSFRFLFAAMLTDQEAEEIERRSRREVSSGPILLTRIDRLLADRRERIQQLEYLRKRLQQVFRYLDGLVVGGHHAVRSQPARKTARVPLCPGCGKPYERAYGTSPNGIVYVHSGKRACRLLSEPTRQEAHP